MTTTEQVKSVRHKSFRFATSLDWLEGRTGLVSESGGSEPLRVGPPPEFRGEPGFWSPEHLLLAAVDSCLMVTFAGMAAKHDLAIISYRSSIDGLLEFSDGTLRFTEIVLKPEIGIKEESAATLARELISKAHDACLIANSLSARVTVEPQIHV